MRILVVAATPFEVEELNSVIKTEDLELITTGVGMVATAYALGMHFASNKYDLAINFGIAGSFDRSIALGEVVEVTEDRFSELGAEDGDDFLSIDQLGFGESSMKSSYELPAAFGLKKVSAITINTVHGRDESIAKISTDTQLESMEGAAFFYACQMAGIPAIQIRAVSNYVERRNRDAWQIGLAIKNLNTFAIDFLIGKNSLLQ